VVGLHDVAEAGAQLARVAPPGGQLRHAVTQPVDAGEQVLAPALYQAVAIREHGHPVAQRHALARPGHRGGDAQGGADLRVQDGRPPRRADPQRWRVPGDAVGEGRALGIDHPVEHRDDLVGHREVADDLVEPREHDRRVRVEQRVGTGGRTDLAHHRRGGHALAHHVPERQYDGAVREAEHVVPVAADVDVHTAGLVVGADVQPVHLGQRVRHQAALELLGVGVLHLVGEAPADRLGDLGGERCQERVLLRGQVEFDVEGQQEAPDAAGIHHQRDGDHALRAEPALPQHQGREPLLDLGHVAQEDRLARADRPHERYVVEAVDGAPADAERAERLAVAGDEPELASGALVESETRPDHAGDAQRLLQPEPGDVVDGEGVTQHRSQVFQPAQTLRHGAIPSSPL
jgi:hypothetical protein